MRKFTNLDIRPYLFLILFVILLLTSLGDHSFAETKIQLTLDQAITMGLKNDLPVNTARNDLEKTKLAVKQEIIKIFPQANIQDSYGYDYINDNYPDSYTLTITDTIPTKFNLYGQKIATNVEAAVWDQVYNETQLQIAEANAIYNTTNQYFTAIKDKEVLQLQEAMVKKVQAASELAQAQLSLGKVTKTDQLKAENDLINANITLEQNRSDYEIALLQLANQIGLDDPTQIELVDDSQLTVTGTIDYQQLKQQALKKRLEMQQAQINITKAQRVLDQAINQGLPVVTLNYSDVNDSQNLGARYNFLSGDLSWSASQKSAGYVAIQNPLDSGTNNNDYFSNNVSRNIMLKFTWNLDFGIAKNQAAQARTSLADAKVSQKQTIQTVTVDLQQAISNYDIAVKKVAANQKMLPYYQKDLEIKKLQHSLGTATDLDVATSEFNLSQAQIEVVKATYDQWVSYQKLKLSAGDLYPFDKKETSLKSITTK